MLHEVYRHQVTPTIVSGKAAMERTFGKKTARSIGGQIGGQAASGRTSRRPQDHSTRLRSARLRVEVTGLEPANLLHAMQALYQLSYTPAGDPNTSVPEKTTAARRLVRPKPRGAGLGSQ